MIVGDRSASDWRSAAWEALQTAVMAGAATLLLLEAFDKARNLPAADLEILRAAILLGVSIDASADEIRSAFRTRLREIHPDHGGDAEATRRLIAARDLMMERVGKATP